MELSLAPRGSIQYPIVMDLQYTTRDRIRRIGMGKTKWINSRDVVFTADQPIPVGSKLEIAISWPVLLNDRVSLKVVIEGELVACGEQEMTARIVKYQFRTRKPPAPPETAKALVAAQCANMAMPEGRQVMCAGR